MLDKIRPYLAWGLLALLVLFILMNLTMTPINLFFIVQMEMPTAFIILISAAMGAGAVYGFLFLKKYQKDKAAPEIPPKP